MKKLTKFDLVLNLWISVIINVALSIVLPIIAMGTLTFAMFIKGFAIAFPVSTILVLVLPIVPLGNRFAAALGAKQNTPVFTLLSTLVLAALLGTLMSLLMTAVNAGIGPWFVSAWLSCYPLVLLTVYLSALLGIFTGVPATKKLVGAPKGH